MNEGHPHSATHLVQHQCRDGTTRGCCLKGGHQINLPVASYGHQDTDMHHRHQIIGIHINRDGFQHSRQQVHKPQRRYNK